MKAWHLEARRMRAEGWKFIAIAAHFGVSESAVEWAVGSPRNKVWHENNRDRVRAYNRKWMAAYRARQKQKSGKIIMKSSLPRLSNPVSIL
jgi:hypothetical protein